MKIFSRILISVIAISVFSGCSYNYLNYRHKKKFRSNYQSPVIQNQITQLRKLDSARFAGGAGVYIRPLMVNKNHLGVYGYNRNSSHFGNVQFFFYRNDSVILVPRHSNDSVINAVRIFLSEHGFSKHEIQKAAKRVESACHIWSSDLW